jgi:large subunit ribosomal protein L13
VVGRVAVVISKLLQGKNKPIYHPAVDMGDHVVVTNTRHLAFSGNKWNQKLYRHHTGYPGGLKEVLAKELHAKSPNKVLYKAVQGMLPKNNLRKYRMRRLHLFPDEVSTHQLLSMNKHEQEIFMQWHYAMLLNSTLSHVL